MKDSIKVVDIMIQKKFKELVDAKREGKSYDFKNELKKELQTTLQQIKDNNPLEKVEITNLLQEIEKHRTKNSYAQ